MRGEVAMDRDVQWQGLRTATLGLTGVRKSGTISLILRPTGVRDVQSVIALHTHGLERVLVSTAVANGRAVQHAAVFHSHSHSF